MADRLRIGIMGTGRIVARWLRDIGEAGNAEVTAIASRDAARAEEAARRYGIARWFDTYEALAESDCCEAVYVATPHTLHRDCALLALRGGKHVLCEKPIAPNLAQFEDMAAAAREAGLLLMEGMWTRFFPTTREVFRLARDGALGEVFMVRADFSFRTPFETETRMFDPHRAGGALLDVGCYGVQYAMGVYGEAPARIGGAAVLGASGVDEQDVVAMTFPCGGAASVACGLRVSLPDTARIDGTKGSVEVPGFWHPTGYTLTRSGRAPVWVPAPERPPEGFAYEVRHFCECALSGRTESPMMPLSASRAALRALDDYRRIIGLRYPFEAGGGL